MLTFDLHPIVNGSCGCNNPDCTQAGKHPAERWSQIPLDRAELVPTTTQGVGIATGKRSDCFVVDLDVKNGIDGFTNFQALGSVPRTYTVATPSGGFHLYFQHPGFVVRNSGPKSNPIAPGVDIRGDGGYVVAPGSPHKNGGVYRVAIDAPIAPAPAWLLDWPGLRHPDAELAQPAGEAEAMAARVPREWRVAKARAWLATQAPAIEGQGGDAHTFKLLTKAVHEWCLTDQDMIDEAFVEWNARCDPPWSGKEWAHKIDSVLHHSTVPWNSAIVQAHGLEVRAPSAEPTCPQTADTQNVGTSPQVPTWITPSQRALRVGGSNIVRLQTEFPTIDSATRGGLLLRKVVAVGGAPGSGKTALAVQLAFRWLSQGIHVSFLAADEDADAILIRFGQLAGLNRDMLENGDPNERRALAQWCDSVPFSLIDGDDEGVCIEAVSLALRKQSNDRPSVLIGDSMQTLRSATPVPKGSDARTRINEVVRALKRAAKVDGHLVLATSEISKAAYRNQDQADTMNPLAAFKESGDIEYGVGLALVLRSRVGTSELIEAVVAKNRLGPGKPTLMLKLDHTRAGVDETNEKSLEGSDPLYFVKADIMAVVEDARGVERTKNQIYELIGGDRNNAAKAMKQLLVDKKLHQTSRGVRVLIPGDPGYGQTS